MVVRAVGEAKRRSVVDQVIPIVPKTEDPKSIPEQLGESKERTGRNGFEKNQLREEEEEGRREKSPKSAGRGV